MSAAFTLSAEFFDGIAAEFDPYLGKMSDKPFSGYLLRRSYERENGDARSAAVAAIDGYHGYTCEFSSCPRQHQDEYDQLETILIKALAKARGEQ